MPKFILTLKATHEFTAKNASDAINQAMALASSLDDCDFSVRAKLVTPDRRVVIVADEEIDNALDCDFENDDQRRELIRQIDQCGVWGFLCEQRDTVDGEWQHVDSCFGFVGSYDNNRDMLASMREHMDEEFRAIEPIDESDADQEDLKARVG